MGDNVKLYDISPVKREKLLKAENKIRKTRLRETLPVLTQKDIRKFRLPYHEALLLELNESGFPSSAEFIRQLLQYQESIREQHEPGSVVWTRPELVHSRKSLDILSDSLKRAEIAHNEENYLAECSELLTTAAHFAFGSDDWGWLGEQLLFLCSSLAYSTDDFRKHRATAFYLLGRYYIKNIHNIESAGYYLEISRELSYAKSWSAKKFLDVKQETIYIESCILLYEVLTEQATRLMSRDPAKAAELSALARKRAAEACYSEGEYLAYLMKGKCDLLLNDSLSAVVNFTKALKIEVKRNSITGICEARINLALAYLQQGKCDETVKNLEELRRVATENEMPYYIGQAFRYMGEYHLNHGNKDFATPLLTVAFYIFHENKYFASREEARMLPGISAGEEFYPMYVKLITSCDASDTGRNNLVKLLKWKDSREIFWESSSSNFTLSYEDALRTSQNNFFFQNPFKEKEIEALDNEIVVIRMAIDESLSTYNADWEQELQVTSPGLSSSLKDLEVSDSGYIGRTEEMFLKRTSAGDGSSLRMDSADVDISGEGVSEIVDETSYEENNGADGSQNQSSTMQN